MDQVSVFTTISYEYGLCELVAERKYVMTRNEKNISIQYSHINEAVIEHLLKGDDDAKKLGLDLFLQLNSGNSPLVITTTALLHTALAHDPSIEIIDSLIEEGADIHAKGEGGFNSLHIVLQNNPHPHLIKALVSLGIDIFLSHRIYIDVDEIYPDCPTMNYLQFAIWAKCSKESLRTLVALGISINESGEFAPPLAVSFWSHNQEYYADMLVSLGADINMNFDSEQSLLEHAIIERDFPLTKYLLDKGGIMTPAAKVLCTEIIQGYIENPTKGLPIKTQDWEPYIYYPDDWEKTYTRLAEWLTIDHNFDKINGYIYHATRAISHANTFSILDTLISRGMNINDVDGFGFTMLHHAVLISNLSQITYLLGLGADARTTVDGGLTLLHYIVIFRSEHSDAIVKRLLQFGVNPNERSNDGYTPLMLSVSNDYDDIELDSGCCSSTIIFSDKFNRNTFLALIQNGCNPNKIDEYGHPLLMRAIESLEESDALWVVNHLLEYGSDINFRDPEGMTPLILACQHHAAVAMDLIEKGADTSLLDNLGKSAFVHAKESYGVHISFDSNGEASLTNFNRDYDDEPIERELIGPDELGYDDDGNGRWSYA